MADIISGSSRFNGDKNAPARKVIQMNNVSEAATHETEDDEIVKHRIKKHRRHMVIIAAIGVIVIAIAVVLVMRLIDGYVFITKQMADVVAPGKPFHVMEVLVDTSIVNNTECGNKQRALVTLI